MWIGSSRDKTSKSLSIKWPDEPIKALGVYYSYDIKLLHEKNFIDRLDSVKKLTNIWSARGLSIYGKVTIIKSLIIPKFVYISSLLPVPKEIVKDEIKLYLNFCGKEPIKWQDFPQLTNMKTVVWKWLIWKIWLNLYDEPGWEGSSSATMVLGEALYGFRWNLLGASFYFIVIMTLKRHIFPLNSFPSYFNSGLSNKENTK